MKTTILVSLHPEESQYIDLMKTMIDINKMRNSIAEHAFEKKLFNRVKLASSCKKQVRASVRVVEQHFQRAVSDVVREYTDNKGLEKVTFDKLEPIGYDRHSIHYYEDGTASIWTNTPRVDFPRTKIKYSLDVPSYFKYIVCSGELIFIQDENEPEGIGRFVILQKVDVPYKIMIKDIKGKLQLQEA